MRYTITLSAKGPNNEELALSSEKATVAVYRNTLTVRPFSEITPDICWTLLYSFELKGFLIVSCETGEAVTERDPHLTTETLSNNLRSSSAWKVTCKGPFVIRPLSNTDLRIKPINALRIGTNAIGVFEWEKGNKSHQLWHINLVDLDVQHISTNWYHILRPFCQTTSDERLVLYTDYQDHLGRVEVQLEHDGDNAQLWTPMYFLSEEEKPFYIVFVNKRTGRALSVANDCITVDITELKKRTVQRTAFWTTGGNREIGFSISPFRNGELGLNVRPTLSKVRYEPGDRVTVGKWKNGENNELWHVELAR